MIRLLLMGALALPPMPPTVNPPKLVKGAPRLVHGTFVRPPQKPMIPFIVKTILPPGQSPLEESNLSVYWQTSTNFQGPWTISRVDPYPTNGGTLFFTNATPIRATNYFIRTYVGPHPK
jgi:hypothetical protein